jgi:hypothetical protein
MGQMVVRALQSEQLPTDQPANNGTTARYGAPLRPSRRGGPAMRPASELTAKLERLHGLGWTVEDHGVYRHCRLEHRTILVFNDGRIVFKDPTITGRHQWDVEWLKVSAFMWPDTTF